MTSYRTWIPSKQEYVRIKEINCEQYRNILKVLDEEEELDFVLSDTIRENLCSEKYTVSDFTVIDKFVIFIQLRIRSCGADLSLVRVCDKCGEKTSVKINLNKSIDALAPLLDKDFKQVFAFNGMQITCDVPPIKTQDNEERKHTLDQRLNSGLFSFIQKIKISDNIVNLNDFSEDEKIAICENLPFPVINHIRLEYIDKINNSLFETMFINNICKNNSCKEKFSLNLNIENMNEVIRVLFSDSTAVNVLIKYANVCAASHIGFDFFKNVSPSELNILSKLIEEENKRATESEQSNNEIDMFDQYRSSTTHMTETPSEFK